MGESPIGLRNYRGHSHITSDVRRKALRVQSWKAVSPIRREHPSLVMPRMAEWIYARQGRYQGLTKNILESICLLVALTVSSRVQIPSPGLLRKEGNEKVGKVGIGYYTCSNGSTSSSICSNPFFDV